MLAPSLRESLAIFQVLSHEEAADTDVEPVVVHAEAREQVEGVVGEEVELLPKPRVVEASVGTQVAGEDVAVDGVYAKHNAHERELVEEVALADPERLRLDHDEALDG